MKLGEENLFSFVLCVKDIATVWGRVRNLIEKLYPGSVLAFTPPNPLKMCSRRRKYIGHFLVATAEYLAEVTQRGKGCIHQSRTVW